MLLKYLYSSWVKIETSHKIFKEQLNPEATKAMIDKFDNAKKMKSFTTKTKIIQFKL